MMGSDMNQRWMGKTASRRAWLAHCSLLGLGLWSTGLKAAAKKPATLLVVGDSLSAEYGIARGSGWVALLERRLAQEKIPAQVINASVSGDTSSGGRSRLPELLKQHRPTHVLVELGGNDALRGLPLAMTRDNLATMVRLSREAGAKVLLLGMQVPPNYGRRYGEEFAALFGSVAKAGGAALVPFFLEGVANAPNAEAMFQPDRIHPVAEAHPVMLGNVWPALAPLLK
jgi:acyl-CoA thioesterase-1